jgi:hypothetical protein
MLSKCSSNEALRRLRENPASRWQSGWEVTPAAGTAWHRITSAPFFTPAVDAQFSVESDDRIFALGSCFAREVEAALSRLGFKVDSLTDQFAGLETYGPRHPGIPQQIQPGVHLSRASVGA